MANGRRLYLEDIHKRFETAEVIKGVTLSVDAGEVVCLLGASGCGKSTTLRIAAGVERQDQGRVEIGGEVMADGHTFLPPERRRVGLMFQDFALFPHMSVADNVAFGLKGVAPAQRRERVMETLERVGMGGHAASFPNTLSGGEQQRVALARALCPRPGVLLMDEPFSGLDARLRDAVRDDTLALVKEMGAATLLVTHDAGEAMRMGDRIALMRAGRIVQTGSPREVYARPVDVGAAAFFSDLNLFRSKVAGGSAPTPLGPIAAPGFSEGDAVEVAIRPQAFALNGQADGLTHATRGTVTRSRLLGPHSLIDLRIEDGKDGWPVQALGPETLLPEPGESLTLGVDPRQVFVFAVL